MKNTAGLLMYRINDGRVEVFLGHHGGPLWNKRDEWTILKGEIEDSEDALSAAIREFREESGIKINKESTPFLELGEFKITSNKLCKVWAFEGDSKFKGSNEFKLEWPPKSGKIRSYPEIDEAKFFSLKKAKQKILKGQLQVLHKFEHLIGETDALS